MYEVNANGNKSFRNASAKKVAEVAVTLSDQLRNAGFPRLASNLDAVTLKRSPFPNWCFIGGGGDDFQPSDADPGL